MTSPLEIKYTESYQIASPPKVSSKTKLNGTTEISGGPATQLVLPSIMERQKEELRAIQ